MRNKWVSRWIKILVWILLLGVVAWAGKGIFKYSVFSTHDGDHHIARSFDAVQTFAQGGFPLRWAGSLNYFCGVPIFNFYYPLIYYLVIVINFFARDVIFSLKIIDIFSLLLGTLGFYLWAKEETKKVWPAFGGAMVYLFAPYRFELIFVRGSPEFLAYAILPVVLFLYAKTFNAKNKRFTLYAFSASIAGAFLTISHNFTVMFLMPIILLYLIVKIKQTNISLKQIVITTFSFIGAFGMGSFFIGPAILEQKYTQIGANFIMWRDHFPELWQLWNSKWGYFYSSEGTINDGMSFMLGYAQWFILGFSALFILFRLIRVKFKLAKFLRENVWVLIFFVGTLFTIFLILPLSIPVWEKIRPLQEIQFSWRLLGVAVFTIAALFVFVLDKIKQKYVLVGLAVGVGMFALVAERNHLLPQPVSSKDLYKYADFEKLHQHRYSTTTLGDEIIFPTSPKACWFSNPSITTDKEEQIISKTVDRNNISGFVKFVVEPSELIGQNVVLNLSYFPGIYKLTINGEPSGYSDCKGLVCFNKNKTVPGENALSWKVGENFTEKFFDWMTVAFFVTWLVVLIRPKKFKPYLPFLIVLAVLIFFRTFNLPSRLGFGWDQERDAKAAMSIISGHPALLGPRVQGPAGFFLPPYFFYLIAPFYAITSGNPIATAIFVGFWSVLFATVSYLVFSKIFDKRIALVFLAIWALNPLAVSMDTIAWNPLAIPLLVILMIYTVARKNLFWSALILGIGVSFHMQFLFIALMLIPTVYEVLREKRFIYLLKSVAGFFIPFLPILIFDIRHNFLNTKLAIQFLGSQANINRVLPVWDRVSAYALGLNPNRLISLTFYILVAIAVFVISKKLKDKTQQRIISGLGIVWAFSLPLYFFAAKNPSEYYFNFLLPIPILAAAHLINLKKLWGKLLLAVIIILFAYKSYPLLASVHLNLTRKTDAVLFLKKVTLDEKPFNISFNVPANEDAGFRYLLDYYKVKYSGDSNDPLIEFVIPADKIPTPFIFSDIGVYIPRGWTSANWVK